MIRVLLFIALLFAVALGFAWLTDLPGTISVEWASPDPNTVPISWEQTPGVAAVVVGILLAIFLAVVWVIRVILKSPHIASRFFRRRRQDKGYAALSQGLIALGTGNAKLARRHAVDADRLLEEEPAAKLLLAQTAQLAGKDDEARQRFEAMLEDPATKALGLHGLFVEAERHKEPVAARHYAEEAAKTAPGLEWAGKAVLGYQAVAHHWDEALKSLERNYAAKLIDKKTYRRQRAVILTALATKLEDGEPERAYSLAKEAHGLALDLVPAAVLTSRLATRRGDIRKASKVLEATWRLFPHPDLAETYAHVRTGDSAVDRLKRVKSLSAQRANTPEGALAVARAALEAREFDEARAQLKKVLQSEPTRKAFLLMAELEEAEHGDRGRMRDWLARAVSAQMDKVWMADGVISADWQAVSPVTGKLDAFRWLTPESLPEDDGAILEDSLFEAPALPVIGQSSAAQTRPEEPGPDTGKGDAGTVVLEAEPIETGASKPSASAVLPGKQGYEGTTDDVRFSPPLKDLPDAASEADTAAGLKTAPEAGPETGPETGPQPATGAAAQTAGEIPAAGSKTDDGAGKTDAKPSGPDPAGTGAAKDKQASAPQPVAVTDDAQAAEGPVKAGAGEQASAPPAGGGKDNLNRPIEFPLSRMPDDPGPDDDETDSAAKTTRPRFFN
ncbi:heme biosynthesis HemY N-terminal domain-containing protein [Roseibium sp. AS2]|uniref:heme biosynthesis protein HemY n=1 Tax=Roseibium sp. AS2 TaxID=3135781 RepID=UPI00316DF7A9